MTVVYSDLIPKPHTLGCYIFINSWTDINNNCLLGYYYLSRYLGPFYLIFIEIPLCFYYIVYIILNMIGINWDYNKVFIPKIAYKITKKSYY